MKVLLKLNGIVGANLGPFELTANDGNVIPQNGTRDELIDGIIVIVDDSATTITLTSNNVDNLCSGSKLILNITGIPDEVQTYNIFYLSSPRSIIDTDSSGCNDIYDFCILSGYTMSSTVYADTTDSTTSSLLNVTLYTDPDLEIPFVGVGSGFRYAVSTTSGSNTIDGPSTYKLIEVNSEGFVNTVDINSCTCEGSTIPL